MPAAPNESEVVATFTVRGDLRDRLEAVSADKLRPALESAFLAAIEKASGEPVDAGAVLVMKRAIIRKDAEEERYALGIAMEPDEVDTQGDTVSADDVKKAAYRWMEAYRNGGDEGHLGLMHKQIVDGKVVVLESYIQKGDADVEGQDVKDGSWLVALRVLDDKLWTDVKKGKLTGLSIGGSAVRKPLS